MEEAARTLGHPPWRVFLRVTLPQLLPAFLSGYLVIALHVLGDFGTVSLLRYETFSYAIYLQYSAAFDRVYAAWLALFLLLLTGSLLLLEAALLRRLSLGRTGRGAARTSPPARLGPLAPLAHLFLLLPFLLAVAFPLYALLHLARRFPASATSGLAEALGHALLVALPVAFLSVGMALPIAYLASRYPSAASRTLERLAYLAYAIPPLAYALAWIFFSLRTLPFLYGTLALLVLALALHFLTESLGPVRSALAQVPLGWRRRPAPWGTPPPGPSSGSPFPCFGGAPPPEAAWPSSGP